MKHSGERLLVFGVALAWGVHLSGCAAMAEALPVVKTVAEIAAEVCEAGDEPLACLKKCESEERRRACECGVLTDEPLEVRCAPCPDGER